MSVRTLWENEEANEWPGEERVKVGGPSQLDPFSQLLFVLYTLRTGVTLYHSAYDFGISTATATRYFVTWVLLLKERLLKIFVRLTSEQIQKTTPPKFQQQYPGQDVKEIWDATEMEIQVPTLTATTKAETP